MRRYSSQLRGIVVLLLGALSSVQAGSKVVNPQHVSKVLEDGRVVSMSNARLHPNPESSNDFSSNQDRDHARSKRSITAFSPDAQEEIADAHNAYRMDVAESSDMQYMTWSDALADQAQTWADKCVMEHGFDQMASVDAQFDSVGQNLFMVSGYLPDNDYYIDSWYGEEAYYTYDTMACTGVCGHYTQIVWASTREIGCGKKLCAELPDVYTKKTTYNAVYVVCNYGPSGNFNGVKPYKLGKPCTECTLGTYQCMDDALCRDCVYEGNSDCTCNVDCGCGVKDATNCTCHSCQDGWIGGRCCAPCQDNHEYCGKQWPKFACALQTYIPQYCPKLCDVCVAPDSPTCTLTQERQCTNYALTTRGGKSSSSSDTDTTAAPPDATTTASNGNAPDQQATTASAEILIIEQITKAPSKSSGMEITSDGAGTSTAKTTTQTSTAKTTTQTSTISATANCESYSCNSNGSPYLDGTKCACRCNTGYQGDRCTVQQEQAKAGVIFKLEAKLSEWSSIWANLRRILVSAINEACNQPAYYRKCCPDAGARTSEYKPYLNESTVTVGVGYPIEGTDPGTIEVMIIAEPLPNNELCVTAAKKKRDLRALVRRILERTKRAASFTYLPQDVLFEACASASTNITETLAVCCNVTVASMERGKVVTTKPTTQNSGSAYNYSPIICMILFTLARALTYFVTSR